MFMTNYEQYQGMYIFSESQSKFVQERITAVERNFGQLCETFSSYVRKTARLRDKGMYKLSVTWCCD